MKQSSKSSVKSHQSSENQPESPECPQFPQKPQQIQSKVSEHLQNIQEIMRICQDSKRMLLDSGRFVWEDEFRSYMDVQVMDTNFQWIRVKLHYGNYRVEIKVIYTEIDQKVFDQVGTKCGGFGVVRFLQYEKARYAVKGVGIEHKQNQIDIDNAYKEYFLCFMAGILEVGPRILPLFGYDILLTKAMAFFAMEECALIRLDDEEMIGHELAKNLKVMHSIGFIHSDIKPQNFAYNLQLRKHVFIDFGLSKLIKQRPGTKTKTNFSGTLSYCSEEMKKCYFLKKSAFVDLYENDACCLKKTIRTVKYIKDAPSFSQQISQSQKFPRELPLLHHIIQILRLKYSIHQQNLPQILQNFPSLIPTPKHARTINQIFSNPEIPLSISNNKDIRQKLQQIKKQIYGSQIEIDSVDTVLYQFFRQDKRVMSAEKIIPITQIMSAQSGFFDRYLEKPDLVLKLLHFFQPFSNGYGGSATNKCKLRRTIVQKIYQMKNRESRSPVFFCQKARFALIYFYENLKTSKNLKSMFSLRILFISLLQWRIAEELQNQIIDMIEQPFLQLLKIVEFGLFRSCFLWNFQRINWKWLKLIERSRGDIGKDSNRDRNRQRGKGKLQEKGDFWEFRKKAMEIFNLIFTSRILPSFPEQLSKHKKQMLILIDEISKVCQKTYQKSSIRNIKYFFLYLCKQSDRTYFNQFSQNIEMKIYLRSWNPTLFQPTGQEQKQEQEKLFWPLRFEYEHQFKPTQTQSQRRNQTIALIRNHFQILKERNEIIGDFIYVMLSVNYYEKEHLYFFIKKIQEFLFSQEAMKAASSCNNEAISELGVEQGIASVNLYMELLERNSNHADQAEKIDNHSKIQLIGQLEKIFDCFIEVQSIKSIINSSSHLKVGVIVTQIKFDLSQGQNPTKTQLAIENLAKLLDPFPFKNNQLVSNFFTLYNYLQQPVSEPGDHYCKNIIVSITEQYIGQLKFGIFQDVKRMPMDYVRIRNERGQSDRSLKLVLELILYYQQQNGPNWTIKLDMDIFTQLVETFCSTLPVETLLKVYLQIRYDKKEFEDGFFSYFVFSVFIPARTLISEADQLKQVIMTTLCLKNMPCLCRTKAKYEIVRLYKHVVPFKSKRKVFISRRLQIRNTFDENKIKAFGKNVSSRIEKLQETRKNFEYVLMRLDQKVQNFNKL